MIPTEDKDENKTGSETWVPVAKQSKQLQSFLMHCLRMSHFRSGSEGETAKYEP